MNMCSLADLISPSIWRIFGSAEAGFGDDLVAAVTGQSPAMVLHNTKRVRQKIRAIQAEQKRAKKASPSDVWIFCLRLSRKSLN